MFILKLFDREGTELKEGDLLQVSDGRGFTFYAEVGYDEKEQIIHPFHTFSFHSFLKVKEVPNEFILLPTKTDTKYKYWYADQPEEDNDAESFKNYFMSWKECEMLLSDRCFRIEKQNKINAHVAQQKLFI